MEKVQAKNYNLGTLLKNYGHQWVALSSDRKKVLANGKSLNEISVKVAKKAAIFMKVFPRHSFYVPQTL